MKLKISKWFKRNRSSNTVDQSGSGGFSASLPESSVPLPPTQSATTAIVRNQSSSEGHLSSLQNTRDPVTPAEPTPIVTVAHESSAESHVSSAQDVRGLPSPALPTPITPVIYESSAENRDLSSQDIRVPSGSAGHFTGAHGFTINHAHFIEINREVGIHPMIKLLLEYVMDGSAPNDASRKYRPSCLPGTREAILRWLLAWFKDPSRAESLFLLTGPAGVGKSAIMQTYTETADHRVITVFISRPNKCNDPNRVFTTIGYRLADQIEAYRNYIVDRVATSPDILNKDMQTQFQVFIVEPFVARNVGAGGPPSAILLDGLDEVEGIDAQQQIIRLIGMFIHKHPDAPLAWIIASRPEFHITNTFNQPPMQGRFKSYTISIDDPDSRQDVARFLYAGFDDIRRDFAGLISPKWPEEAKLAKLVTASSGLFIFAQTALRFIRDPDYSDPVSRLDIVLSVIDRSKDVPREEQPFKNLDNLYTEILSRIPAGVLPTTKRLLGLALAFRSDDFLGLRPRAKSRTLRGMALILQLDPNNIHPGLINCISMLKIPRQQEAHKMSLIFLHASFADYLVDAERSGKFYIDVHRMVSGVLLGYLKLWDRYSGRESAGGAKFISDGMAELPDNEIAAFTTGILQEMGKTLLTGIVERHKPQQVLSSQLDEKDVECFDAILNINMIRLCKLSDGMWTANYGAGIVYEFVEKACKAWKEFPHELGERGMFREVYYEDMNIDLNNNGIYMVTSDFLLLAVVDGAVVDGQVMHQPPKAIDHATKQFLHQSPNLQVLICGGTPGGQVALIPGDDQGQKYCIVPYQQRT